MSVDTRPPVARSAGWKAVELPRPLSFAFRGGDDGSTSKFAATDEAVQSRLRVGGDHRSSNSRTGGARVDAVHKIKGNEENGANCPVACLGERGRVRIKKNGWPLLLFTMGAGVSYMFTHYNVQAYMGYRKGKSPWFVSCATYVCGVRVSCGNREWREVTYNILSSRLWNQSPPRSSTIRSRR